MQETKFNEALSNVDESYKNISKMVEDIVSKCTKKSDEIIKKISNRVESLSKDELRKNILELSSEVYIISDVKERASLHLELAELLHKEKMAQAFTSASGTQKEKENKAYTEALEEKLVEILHASVESQLKGKILRINEFIENLKSVLISRISEDKNISNM